MEQVLQDIMPLVEEKGDKKSKKSPAFISYKEGHKGQHNPGIEVKLSSDDLFRILFGPHSKVGVRSHGLLAGYLQRHSWSAQATDIAIHRHCVIGAERPFQLSKVSASSDSMHVGLTQQSLGC